MIRSIFAFALEGGLGLGNAANLVSSVTTEIAYSLRSTCGTANLCLLGGGEVEENVVGGIVEEVD